MSQPSTEMIGIGNNVAQIKLMLSELVLQPRLNAIKWSIITKQTPNIKVGYPGQHLASLITGMEGERTGARGNDLLDGSEVKSCSRIDQLDRCLSCDASVARLETSCAGCNSTKILRNNDSKWLFGIRDEDELNLLTKEVPRIVLILADYPNFDEGDFDTIRFQSFEIWTNNPRHKRFGEIMNNYYANIYLAHKKNNANKTPAPKNFWPYSFQFYISNPIRTFSCIVKNANTSPKIFFEEYIEPKVNRDRLQSVLMPADVLNDVEIQLLLKKATDKELAAAMNQKTATRVRPAELRRMLPTKAREHIATIGEELRAYLPLRDTDRITTSKIKYSRKKRA